MSIRTEGAEARTRVRYPARAIRALGAPRRAAPNIITNAAGPPSPRGVVAFGPMQVRGLGLTSRPVVDRVVNATIALMSVLVLYDGWEELKLIGVVAVIVGPVLAMFLAHVFAASIAEQVDLGRGLTGRERLKVVRTESRFLLLAVPPVVIVVAFYLVGVSLADCIRVVLWVGVASLGCWGGVAGRRAGFTGWHLALAVFAGLVIGGTILALQVFLKPGTASPDGIGLG
jgi:hypothetical protein